MKIFSWIFVCLGFFKCTSPSSVPYFPGRLSHTLCVAFGLAAHKKGRCIFFDVQYTAYVFLSTLIRGLKSNSSKLRVRKIALSHVWEGRCSNSTLGLYCSLTKVHIKQSTVSRGFEQCGFASSSGAKLLPGLTRQGVCNGGSHIAVPLDPLCHFSHWQLFTD